MITAREKRRFIGAGLFGTVVELIVSFGTTPRVAGMSLTIAAAIIVFHLIAEYFSARQIQHNPRLSEPRFWSCMCVFFSTGITVAVVVYLIAQAIINDVSVLLSIGIIFLHYTLVGAAAGAALGVLLFDIIETLANIGSVNSPVQWWLFGSISKKRHK